jgi:magnesium transporter
VGLVAWAWQGNVAWGLVVGLALLLNLLVAGSLGALIPLALRALRLDPAIASGIFLMTFTDVLGFLFLLGLATLLMSQLT